MISTKRLYSDPKFGKPRKARDYEDMVVQVTALRPDAVIEGSAGFERSIISRENNEMIGVAKANWKTGEYVFRLLATGSIPL